MEDIDFLINLLNNKNNGNGVKKRCGGSMPKLTGGLNTMNCTTTDTPEDEGVFDNNLVLPVLGTMSKPKDIIKAYGFAVPKQQPTGVGFYNPAKKYLAPLKMKKM
jgi:hypothetical protein